MVEIPTDRHDRRENHDWHARDVDAVLPPPALLKRVSWGAIFAGAVIAVALTALFGLLGLGLGFDAIDPTERNSLEGIPKATLAWWAVISVLATGIGGFVAGRLAGIPRGLTGALHGLSVWAVTTLLTLWLATSAVGTVLGAATSVVTTTARVATGAAGTAGGAVVRAGGAVAPGDEQVDRARADIQSEAQQILQKSGIGQTELEQGQEAVGEAARNIAMRPGSAGAEIDRLIAKLFEGPDAVLSPQERERLVDELSQRTGVSREEAQQTADRWQAQAAAARERTTQTVDRTRNRAGEVSGDVLDTLADAAWGMFLISLAGLVAALIGAALAGASLFGSVPAAARSDEDRV